MTLGGTPAPEFVGLGERQAADLAAARGMHIRVAVRDGESFALAMNLRTDRVNLVINDGVVEEAFVA
jgi:hypothetical protein